MSTIEEMVSELEGIGAIGDKVVMLKQTPKVMVVPDTEEVVSEEPESPPVAVRAPHETEVLRERLAALSLKADEKLAAVIDAVQDLRGVFQELHEATQGDVDAEISEEA